MTIYFYDDKELSLIAVDAETKVARMFKQAVLGQGAPLPADELDHAAFVTPSPVKKTPKNVVRKPGQPCDECGSKGKRHKKGCSLAGGLKHQAKGGEGNSAWQKLDSAHKLSRSIFGRIKLSQSLDILSDVIARELGLSLEQVNSVMKVRAYEDL
jgi:hypothetical protein